MKERNYLGICILAGFLALAISLPFAVGKYTGSFRQVTVKGLCEKEVDADRAIWPIVFKESGNSLSALASEVEIKNAIIVEWLKEAGFADDEINISAPKLQDLKSDGYIENKRFDYIMTSVVTVCTSKASVVVGMQRRQFELLGKGIAIGSGNSWEYPVVFDYTSLNSIKAEMVEQAIRNARESADKFAKDSGSRLGRIVTASQGQFSINNRDENTPEKKIIRVVSTVTYSLR